MANFLSHLDDHLPPGEVQDYLNKIPYPGVKAVLDNAIMPLTKRAEQGVRPNPDNQKANPEVTVGATPAKLASTNITNWKLEQQEDPVLYQVVKHRKASPETFKKSLTEGNRQKSCLGLCEIQGPTDYEERPPVSAVQTRTDPGNCTSICCSPDSLECGS